jgi:hypothetical protein
MKSTHLSCKTFLAIFFSSFHFVFLPTTCSVSIAIRSRLDLSKRDYFAGRRDGHYNEPPGKTILNLNKCVRGQDVSLFFSRRDRPPVILFVVVDVVVVASNGEILTSLNLSIGVCVCEHGVKGVVRG